MRIPRGRSTTIYAVWLHSRAIAHKEERTPIRRFRLTILSALAIVLLTATASAQSAASASVPNLIRYSGTLKDAPGAALASTAPVGVTFAIYNQEDGGAPVWQETQNVTLSANGQYSVILGSTTATGLPDDLFSPQEQRWLGVQVQGQEEQARVLLVSVPYALKAHEADTLGGMPASAFIQAATLGAAGITSTNGTLVHALSTTGTPPGARGKDGKLPPNGCLEVSRSSLIGTSWGALSLDALRGYRWANQWLHRHQTGTLHDTRCKWHNQYTERV